ncbi:MAG: spore protease YyaC [Syntrophomonadaceae bacterium]|nr:spore protease YyaC [Syntrophomonadaceae bacterium]
MGLFQRVRRTVPAERSFHYEAAASLSGLEDAVYGYLNDYNPNFRREMVYICIGTDRATGDCLGPLVGTQLAAAGVSPYVYGTLERPVHAGNLYEVLDDINRKCPQAIVLAVDASLGSTDRIGWISLRSGSLKPGTALQKELPEVGDFHISGVVNIGGFLDQMVLQNTRLYVVHRMADVIARAVGGAHRRFAGKYAAK